MKARIPPLGSGTEGPSQQTQEVKQECKWGKKALSPSSAAPPHARTHPPTLPRTQTVFPTSLFKPAGLPGLECPYLV